MFQARVETSEKDVFFILLYLILWGNVENKKVKRKIMPFILCFLLAPIVLCISDPSALISPTYTSILHLMYILNTSIFSLLVARNIRLGNLIHGYML